MSFLDEEADRTAALITHPYQLHCSQGYLLVIQLCSYQTKVARRGWSGQSCPGAGCLLRRLPSQA